MKPKIVLIYVGMTSLNPTIPDLVKDFEGLGIVCIDILRTDSAEFARLSKGAALVLFDENLFACRNSTSGIRNFMVFDLPLQAQRVNEVLEVAADSGSVLGIFADKFDLHRQLGGGLSDEELALFSILIWPYIAAPPARADVLATPYSDPWMQLALDPLANWKKITELIPHQVEYTHVLLPNEIRRRSPNQFWDTCVPGASYATRRIAHESALSNSLSVAPLSRSDFVIRGATSALARGTLAPSIQRLRFRLRRSNLAAQIRASRSAFVCGGGYRYLVRKYLEVPALGVPMIGFPTTTLERNGFVPEVHYISAHPEDHGDAASRVKRDVALAARIASNASELVSTHHVPQTRLPRMISVLEAILAEEASGGHFIEGKLTPY